MKNRDYEKEAADFFNKSTRSLTDQAIEERNARWDELNELLDRDREENERELAAEIAFWPDETEEEEEIIYQLERWGSLV